MIVIRSTLGVYEPELLVEPPVQSQPMHASSHEMMGEFVEVHLDEHRGTPLEIIDFGAQMIGAESLSYRSHLGDPAWTYRGIDIVEGRGVDVVLGDPYRWSELSSESVDLFVSGQAFEHIEHFWVTIFEVVRVLKPGGVTAIIAPSSGHEHRFPVDCWRFYPDGFAALARYVQCEVVESFTDWGNGEWGDTILVLRKPTWSDSDRERFNHRAGLQRLMLSEQSITPARIADEWQFQPQSDAAPASALASLSVGALTTRLTARRDQRVATDIGLAEHAEQERVHELAGLQERAVGLADENEHLRAALAVAENAVASAGESPIARTYGTVRAKVADLAGDQGRALYKKLRGRS